jgi:carboxyl-terminal processing protease
MGNGISWQLFLNSKNVIGKLVLCFFTVAMVLPNAAWSKSKSIDDHWAALGFKFERIERQKKLSTAQCNKDEKSLIACTHAINAILAYAPTSLRLVPESYRAARPEYSAPSQTFGLASLVEAPKSQAKNMAQLILESRKVKKEIAEGWKTAFATLSADAQSQIDFEAIVSGIKKEPFFAENEAKIVGAVTNAFYEILHDPHTMVIPTPSKNEMFEAEETIVGIGATMQPIEREGKKYPVVHQVLEDSPAHKGGLLPKDVITDIDGAPIAGQPMDEIISKIRGAEGTKVALQVLRGDTTLELTLVRSKLENRNVRSKLVGDAKEVGYVRLNNFMEMNPKTGEALPCIQVRAAITDLEGQGAKSLILDLRDNGGGLIGEAECISNLFLDLKSGEPIVSTKSLIPEKRSFMLPDALPAKIHTKLPLVVLMNSSSASASEIVAGALQDYERAFLIGERTYGKGSVQTFRPLGSRGELELKETTARFYLPSGRTNQIATVRPDVERYSQPNPTDEDKVAMREEDSYTALPPVGPEWIQTRPELVGKLESCMQSEGTAETNYKNNLQGALGADFQLYSAIDAAKCVVSKNLWDISMKRPSYSAPPWIVQDRAKDFFNKNVMPLLQQVF